MAVKDLHEAAKVLQGAYQALAKVMAEAEPFELAYIKRWEVTHDPATGEVRGMTEEEWDAYDVECGYKAFYDAADAIEDLAFEVEFRLGDAQARHYRTADAA